MRAFVYGATAASFSRLLGSLAERIPGFLMYAAMSLPLSDCEAVRVAAAQAAGGFDSWLPPLLTSMCPWGEILNGELLLMAAPLLCE